MDLSTPDSNNWSTLLEYLKSPHTDAQRSAFREEHSDITELQAVQRRFTEEEVAQIAAQYATGKTVYELADRYGCKRQAISKVLKRNGVATRYRILSNEQIDEAVRLYASGLSLTRISDQLGVSARTVRTRLLDRGVAMRDSHGRERGA